MTAERDCEECQNAGCPDCEPLPEGGYCFDCRIAFQNERQADAHYAMTGHQIGWPFEDVDWPQATDLQIIGHGIPES